METGKTDNQSNQKFVGGNCPGGYCPGVGGGGGGNCLGGYCPAPGL